MIKVPPSAVEMEKAVLGAILIERDALGECDLLRPEMFYEQRHQDIFAAILSMHGIGRAIDCLTVSEYMGKSLNEPYYLTQLTNSVVSSKHTSRHAKAIVEKWMQREQIRIANAMLVSAYDQADPFETQETAEKELHELITSISLTDAAKIDSVLVDVYKQLDKLRDRETFLTGVTSGYKSLDGLTMGWQPSDLVIIAARPAVGKTAFTLSLAVNAASAKIPAAFFSLEMSRHQLVKRVLAAQARMYLSTIKAAMLDDEQMQHLFVSGVRPLSQIPLYIDDTASMTVAQFKGRLRKLVRKYGVKIAVVDYLQLLKSTLGKNTNRQQQIGEISRELKITAKELDIPIIALSQLSREVEKRKGTPQLSDLREAGDIEQDADMVMFLYGHPESEILSDVDKANEIFVKIAKHRNGELGNIKFRFEKAVQSFSDSGVAEEPGVKIIATKYHEDNPF